MRAEKKGGGWVPVKPGLKHYKQGTIEMQSMGNFEATKAAIGYRDIKITREKAPQKKRSVSQLSRNQNNKTENT